MAKKQQKLSAAARDRIRTYGSRQDLGAAKASRRKRDNRIAITAAICAIAVAFGAQLSYGFLPQPTPSVSLSAQVPNIDLAEDRTWTGTMLINGNPIQIELDGKKAPQAVANFVTLAKRGFYNGLSCHRLTTTGIYVLQCGDPNADGSGGPGYSFGPVENAPANDVYQFGTLAMARQANDGNSMGSQFFIVYANSNIPSDEAGGYTVFGKITANGEALNATIEGKVADGSGDGKPAVVTTINTVQVK